MSSARKYTFGLSQARRVLSCLGSTSTEVHGAARHETIHLGMSLGRFLDEIDQMITAGIIESAECT